MCNNRCREGRLKLTRVKSTTPRSERTRTELLDVAWERISAEGARVSMAEIATAAGVSRQSVYVHFGSRAGLLMALVHRADERFRIIEDFGAALAIGEPRARFAACLDVWLGFVPKIHPVARDLIRIRSEDDAADAAWSDRMRDLHRMMRELMRGIERDGELAPGFDAASAADYLWAGASVQTWDLLVSERGVGPRKASRLIRVGMTRTLLR